MLSQALPIFLDSLVDAYGAIIISVTLILICSEVSVFLTLFSLAVGFIQECFIVVNDILSRTIFTDFSFQCIIWVLICGYIMDWGQIIPQAVCSRYGLAVGAAMSPVVRVLLIVFFPVSYPISKVFNVTCPFQFQHLLRR